MASKLDKSKLGVDKDIFSMAEIRLVKQDAPIIDFINQVILEDNKDEISVVKHHEGDVTNRPYFVVYNPILHAKMAYYMTSSIPEDRMKLENKIWGHHYIKTPDYIYHYLDNSSIRGKVSEEKLHLIDKDRFLFVTEDSMMDIESRATRAEDIVMSMYAHFNNAFKIEDVVKKDLRPEQFEKIVRQGKKERWVYNRKPQNPVVYSPTAMYLLLYVNAMSRFANKKFAATPELLQSRCDTLLSAIDALGAYLIQDDKLKKLQQEDELTYKVFKNARYYNGITASTLKSMQLADGAEENYYKNICGHPYVYEKLPIEERIKVELNRQRVKDNKKRAQITAKVLKLFKEEDSLKKKLSGAASKAIEDLNQNPREKLNLSAYEMDYSLLDAIKKVTNSSEHYNFVKEAAIEYYNLLKENFITEVARRKQASSLVKEREEQKEQAQEYERIANEYALAELTNQINTRFLGTFDGIYKQYVQGHLLVDDKTLKEFETLLTPTKPLTKSMMPVSLGANLHQKLNGDLVAMNAFSERIQAAYYGLKDAQEHLGSLLETKEGKLAEHLLTDVVNQQIKVRLRCTGLSEREKQKQTMQAVKDMLDPKQNPFAIEYTSVTLDYESLEGDLLATMQDIATYKAELKGMSNIKANRQKLISALEVINDPITIQNYMQSLTLVKSFNQEEFTKNGGVKPLPLQEIANKLDSFVGEISKGNLTNKDYIRIENEIYAILAKMNNFIQDTSNQIKEKGKLDEALKAYDALRIKNKAKIKEQLKVAEEEFLGKTKEELLEFTTNEEITDDATIVINGRTPKDKREMTGAVYKEANQKFYNINQSLLDISNYSKPQDTLRLTEEMYDKCFPTINVLESAISKKLAKVTNAKEANKILKQETDKLSKAKEDIKYFLQSVAYDEYMIILNNASAVINAQNVWNSTISTLSSHNEYSQGLVIPKDDEEREFFEDQVKFLEEGTLVLQEEVGRHIKEFIDIMYNCTQEIVDNMDYRTDFDETIETQLRRHYTQKGRRIMMAAVPSSIVGDRGIGNVLYELADAKAKHVAFFNEILAGEGTDSADHTKAKRYTIDRVSKYCEQRLCEKYSNMIEEDGCNLESLRAFAARGQEEYEFVTRSNGFKNMMGIFLDSIRENPSHLPKSVEKKGKILAKELIADIAKIKKMKRDGKLNESVGIEDESITELIEECYRFSTDPSSLFEF